ncbi:MAG: uracil-xanthine permease [Clostridia bacterium]|nr:uracil-xanthine permease [Clostridia bacterium]
MKLIYGINDKPPFGKLVLFSLQQLLSIVAATILVPMLVNANGGEANGVVLSTSSALLGAGLGTFVYLLFTKGKSPVFLGSSFAFLGALYAATANGYMGILLGAVLAGLVYVIIAIVVKISGTKWISKLLPPVIIGPTVALIGLSLAGSAINNVQNTAVSTANYNLIHILCALITFVATVIASCYGKKTLKMIPFIIGIGAGYVASVIFTLIGNAANIPYLQIVDFSAFADFSFKNIISVPDNIVLFKAIGEMKAFDWTNVASIALLFMPVAFVVLAEHIADHKNLSFILSDGDNQVDLLEDPGLTRTLLGDGIGSMVGTLFGCCPNTTYGESVGCVAITKNASVYSIVGAAIMAIIVAFITPFELFVSTIPSCVVGGISIALYGFIAVSGLKMIQQVDLNQNKNLFVVAAILIPGIGGLTLNFGGDDPFNAPIIKITNIAVALILGIIVNAIVSKAKADDEA